MQQFVHEVPGLIDSYVYGWIERLVGDGGCVTGWICTAIRFPSAEFDILSILVRSEFGYTVAALAALACRHINIRKTET